MIRFFISFGMNGAVCVFVCVTCECACVCMEVRECFNRTESWRSRVAELHWWGDRKGRTGHWPLTSVDIQWGFHSSAFSHYLYFCPDADWSIQSKHQQGFPSLSWYHAKNSIFSVYAGANWEATTLKNFLLLSPAWYKGSLLLLKAVCKPCHSPQHISLKEHCQWD